jgi:prepilin peptidase CpaA
MSGHFSDAVITVLAVLLFWAAIGDWRSRDIPNWLNGAIALLAIPFWWGQGLALWPDVALQLGLAIAVFALFSAAFFLGAMGGGDVKMLGALALWLPALAVLKLLVIVSLAGGALTLVMLVRHRLTRNGGALEIPYGIAIAFGGLWLISERLLNQFA